MRIWLRRILCTAMAVWLNVAALHFAIAQIGSLDVNPPDIEIELIELAPPSAQQIFTAVVRDDRVVEEVRLFYRQQGQSSYQSMPMQLSSNNRYAATVDWQAEFEGFIEYYVTALDGVGNRTLQGYSFDPLQRLIEAGASNLAAAPATVGADSSNGRSGKTLLYTVLGVVAVGALIALAGNSSDDQMADEQCAASGCRLTINIAQP